MFLLIAGAAILAVVTCDPTTPAYSSGDIAQSLFRSLDTDHDGVLSKAEALGLVQRLDTNGDNKTSLVEYLWKWVRSYDGLPSVGMKIYSELDSSWDGFIAESEANSVFAYQLDSNGDAQVSEGEFKAFITRYLPPKSSTARPPTTKTAAQAFLEARLPLVDANHDGIATLEEQWADAKHFDVNGDDFVNMTEFIQPLQTNMPAPYRENWPDLFAALDLNHNGLIERSDVMDFRLLSDTDDNGVLTTQELSSGFEILEELMKSIARHMTGELTSSGPGYRFSSADIDYDGSLTLDQEWNYLTVVLDENKDKKIGLGEFQLLFQYFGKNLKRAGASLFQRYDRNIDGLLEKSDVGDFFNDMDSNGDGKVSRNAYSVFIEKIFTSLGVDIRTAFTTLGETMRSMSNILSLEDTNHDFRLSVDEMFNSLLICDENDDGNLTKAEFILRYTATPNIMEAAPKIFEILDVNKDGILQVTDLTSVIDKDGNGVVEEFDFSNLEYKVSDVSGLSIAELVRAESTLAAAQFSFNDTDKTQDRSLDSGEILAGLMTFDKNGDHKVSREEYLGTFREMYPNGFPEGSKFESAFEFMDSDHNGFIDGPDSVVMQRNEDTDGDGRVPFSEFAKYMIQMRNYTSPAAQNVTWESQTSNHTIFLNQSLAAGFAQLDTDGDGNWTVAEHWANLLKFDRNGDYRIRQGEFLDALDIFPFIRTPLGSQLFSAYDVNSNDYLDEGDVAQILSSADTDGNHSVSPWEYLQLLVEVYTAYTSATTTAT